MDPGHLGIWLQMAGWAFWGVGGYLDELTPSQSRPLIPARLSQHPPNRSPRLTPLPGAAVHRGASPPEGLFGGGGRSKAWGVSHFPP